MQLRALVSWCLLGAGLTLALRLLVSSLMNGGGSPDWEGVDEALSVLLLGLPAFQAAQPQTGRLGQVGLWCLGLAVGLAIVLRAMVQLTNADIGTIAPFASALLGLIGSVLEGWVTIQARVFPAAGGWLLIAGGVLNLADGLLPSGAITTAIGVLGVLAQAAAEVGYGWGTVRGVRVHRQPA